MSVTEIREAVYAAASRVECPLCKQPPGDKCRSRAWRGVHRRLAKPHGRRIDAAREDGHWSIGEVAK